MASMAAFAIFWNRHYCIDFLDVILTYGDAGAKDNILVNNLWIYYPPWKWLRLLDYGRSSTLQSLCPLDGWQEKFTNWKNMVGDQ